MLIGVACCDGTCKRSEQRAEMRVPHGVRDDATLLDRLDDPGTLQELEMPGNHRQINLAALSDLAHRAGPTALGQAPKHAGPRGIAQCFEHLGVEQFVERSAARRRLLGSHASFTACLRHRASIGLAVSQRVQASRSRASAAITTVPRTPTIIQRESPRVRESVRDLAPPRSWCAFMRVALSNRESVLSPADHPNPCRIRAFRQRHPGPRPKTRAAPDSRGGLQFPNFHLLEPRFRVVRRESGYGFV